MTIDFYSRLNKGSSPSSSKDDVIDFYSRTSDKKEGAGSKKKLPKAARLGTQYLTGAAEMAAFPYEVGVAPLASKDAQHAEFRKEIFSDIERLEEQKSYGDWSSQDQNLLDRLKSQIKDTNKSEPFVKTADIGVGSLIEKGGELAGYDLSPEGVSEHVARIGGNVVNPKNLLKIPSYVKKLANKEARQAIKAEKQWKNLERASAGSPEKETLLNFAKEKNLTPQESTLLLHSRGDAKILSKFSKKTKALKGAVSGLKKKLGNEYQALTQLGREGGYLNLKESEALTKDLAEIAGEMDKTFFAGPDTKSARTAIQETIENVLNKPGTVEDLINTRQGLREGVNWGKVDKGDILKKRAEDAVSKAIKNKNPYVHERLVKNDLAYSKYKQFESVLKDKTLPLKFKGVELPSSVTPFLVYGATYALGGVKGLVAKEALQRLSTEIAINPAFQKPVERLQKALLNGSKKSQRQAFITIKHIAKEENPDLYEEIKDLDLGQ